VHTRWGLIITDGREFFSEERRHASSLLTVPAEGVPAYHLENTCRERRYRIEKDIITGPRRDGVLQQTRFTALQGGRKDYHLYVLLAPHLGNRGAGNSARRGDDKGVPMLFAERDGNALALACSAGWLRRSAGFVGVSDGWQDLVRHKSMTWEYERAGNGNVAVAGEIDLAASNGAFLLALGSGSNAAEAGNRGLASLYDGFEPAEVEYVREWQAWQRTLPVMDEGKSDALNLLRVSEAVLGPTSQSVFPAALSPASPFPGVLPGAMTILADTTVCGRGTWSNQPEASWPQKMWLNGMAY
jgi:glucoamylase